MLKFNWRQLVTWITPNLDGSATVESFVIAHPTQKEAVGTKKYPLGTTRTVQYFRVRTN